MKPLFSNFFLIFAFFCFSLVGYLFWQRNNPNRLSFALSETSAPTSVSTASATPTRLSIPDLKIDLAIYPASRDGNKWEATTKGVSYLESSPAPGQTGNSILYGHNWRNLLGNLTRVKPGQEIRILFSDGSAQIFVIENIAIVSPEQTSVLNQTKDKRITLYTCTGLLDRKRFVVMALLFNN